MSKFIPGMRQPPKQKSQFLPSYNKRLELTDDDIKFFKSIQSQEDYNSLPLDKKKLFQDISKFLDEHDPNWKNGMSLNPQFIRSHDSFNIYGPEKGFREGTKIKDFPCYFLLNSGGIGDYINYLAAILWVAKTAPWIHGHIFANGYFLELIHYFFRDYPHWQIRDGSNVPLETDLAVIGPDIQANGVTFTKQLANATGSHLMDLGFQYYANKTRAPEGWTLPYVSQSIDAVPVELRDKIKKCVILTPGGLAPARLTTGKHLNPLIDWIVAKGLTPVFLGKSEVVKDLNPVFSGDISWEKGVDMRDKTSLMQAAAIMEHALCTVGLDNGLLHLASCTPGNVAFGYNITSIEHREPRRNWGKLINVALTKEDLSCISCQSNWKLVLSHTFHKCYYKDTKCIDLLFSSGQFEAAIETFMKEEKNAI